MSAVRQLQPAWQEFNPPGSNFRDEQTWSIYKVERPCWMPPTPFPVQKQERMTSPAGLRLLPSSSLKSVQSLTLLPKSAPPSLHLVLPAQPRRVAVSRETHSPRLLIIEAGRLLRLARDAGAGEELVPYVLRLQADSAKLIEALSLRRATQP